MNPQTEYEIDAAIAMYGFDDDPDDFDCTWCGGEGYSECDDPLGCPGPHIGGPAMAGGECPCQPCNGTGLRSQQTVF